MITDELFSKEFESFHFKEIHRNPPKSLLASVKPPAGLPGVFGGILAGGFSWGQGKARTQLLRLSDLLHGPEAY